MNFNAGEIIFNPESTTQQPGKQIKARGNNATTE
jgi:hypothetical protein